MGKNHRKSTNITNITNLIHHPSSPSSSSSFSSKSHSASPSVSPRPSDAAAAAPPPHPVPVAVPPGAARGSGAAAAAWSPRRPCRASWAGRPLRGRWGPASWEVGRDVIQNRMRSTKSYAPNGISTFFGWALEKTAPKKSWKLTTLLKKSYLRTTPLFPDTVIELMFPISNNMVLDLLDFRGPKEILRKNTQKDSTTMVDWAKENKKTLIDLANPGILIWTAPSSSDLDWWNWSEEMAVQNWNYGIEMDFGPDKNGLWRWRYWLIGPGIWGEDFGFWEVLPRGIKFEYPECNYSTYHQHLASDRLPALDTVPCQHVYMMHKSLPMLA